MRLTLRSLLCLMRALESSLEEVENKLRGTAHFREMAAVCKSQRETRKLLYEILDRMVDSGFGE